MAKDDYDPVFDYDNDGRLDSFEQSEAELFTYGDGSMSEPDGIKRKHSGRDDGFYCEFFDDDEEDDENFDEFDEDEDYDDEDEDDDIFGDEED